MENTESELLQELKRLIECPYPASFSNLAAILARSDDRIVQSSIHHLPSCDIAWLASIVAESLSLWSHSLRILHGLCHASEFRDAVLKENPNLLDALLSKASGSQQGFDEYAELCVLLLSTPLPREIPLPASAQSFFLRLFDKAAKDPSVGTLRPIYTCLNGACSELLALLSPEVQQSLDESLRRILKTNSAGKPSMLLLWCSGIVVVAAQPHNAETTSWPMPRAEGLEPSVRPWRTAAAQKLFDSANKCITMIYHHVIWACRGNDEVSDNEAIEGVRIAIRTMQLIDRDTRTQWPTSAELPKRSVPKLTEKILRDGIDAGVQLQAMCFYAIVHELNNLPASMVAQYGNALLGLKNLHMDTETLRETLSTSLPLFAPRLHESTIRQILAALLQVCLISDNLLEVRNTLILVEALMAAMPNVPNLSIKLLSALLCDEIQGSIGRFLEGNLKSTGSSKSCTASITSMRLELHSATLAMLLTSALLSKEVRLLPGLVLALVNKQRDLAKPTKQCNHAKRHMKSTVSLFEQECTPSTGLHRRDWREQIRSTCQRHNNQQGDEFIRICNQIFQDLETRVNTAEEPLRREQSKVEELTTQVSQLHLKLETLKNERLDQRLFAEGLEAEIESKEKENRDLSAKFVELKAEFTRVNREADERLRAAQDDFKARELEFQGMVLTHEQDVRKRTRETENLIVQLQELKDTVQKEQNERQALNGLYQALEDKCNELQGELQSERQSSAQKSEEMGNLKGTIVSLEEQLHASRSELDKMMNEREELQVSFNELLRSSEQALHDLELRYNHDLESSESKAANEYKRLNNELQDANNDLESVRSALDKSNGELQLARTTVDTLEEKTTKLEEKVQELTKACAEKEDALHEKANELLEKDEELQALKSWRRKLMQTMDDSPKKLMARRSDQPHNHIKSSLKSTQHHRSHKPARGNVAATRSRGNTGISNIATENVADASFSSNDSDDRNGSTPKRRKPTASFKAPDMRTPYSQKPRLAHKSAHGQLSPTKRTALGAVSPNRRHTTVGFALSDTEEHDEKPEDKMRRVSLQYGPQASYDMDGFMDSTPFTPGKVICGTGREPEEDSFEEQTAEL